MLRLEKEALEHLPSLAQEENKLLKEKVASYEVLIEKMKASIEHDEQVLDNLCKAVENGANKISSLEQKVKFLDAEGKKKYELITKLCSQAEANKKFIDENVGSITKRSITIYDEYCSTLATFGAEPLPLPRDPEGGITGLLDWMLNEFVGLRDILVAVSDNSAALACESILGLLDQEGCQDIEKLGAKEFKYPTYSDLKKNLVDVQSAKKMFLRRFWKASGREAIRATAAARLAEVCHD